ncbi:hypothetical protein [Haloarcula laminariae]|uniref:hypothetical protein n=1 Tax=Haloarcula laminariae TaxID=2961577 RepID=UPI0021C67793|nr:hypothetical protein [Halomicroarcula laminariae]
MNYTAMYRSNIVAIADEHVDEVEELLGGDPPETGYRFDGQYELDGTELALFSTATTFDAWTPNDEQVTEQFLETLAAYLADGEVLLIRSVGYTGTRHIPDAYQHIAPANGEVEIEQLRDPKELETVTVREPGT